MMGLGVALVLTGALVPQDEGVSQEVAREWRVRALALGAEAWPEEVGDLDWEERCVLLDAVRRADPASLDERAASFVIESLGHDHSNVRALALVAARRLDRGLPAGRAAIMALDLLPEVRLELATSLLGECDPELRAWSHGEGAETAHERATAARAVLLDLALDPERRVRERASAVLFSLGEVALEEQLTWWISTRMDERPMELLRVVEVLSRGALNPELARFGRDRFANSGDLARAALWETVVGRLGLAPRVDLLALGWTAELGDEDGADALRIGRLMGAASVGGSPLAYLLLREARAGGDERERQELAVGFAQAAGLRDRALFAQLSLADAGFRQWAWEGFFGRADTWEVGLIEPWLSRDRSEVVRRAVFAAVAETLTRTGDEGARQLVVLLLEDEGDPLFDAAFRALCSASDLDCSLVALHAAWRRTQDPRRAELLRSLPRDVLPLPFREDLLQRWRPGRSRDASSLELLTLFRDDAGVARAVCAYLAEHVAAYEASGVHPDRVLEGRLIALIEASRALCGEDVLQHWNRALAAGAERSKEVVKVCGAALQSSRAGRALLADWVEKTTASRARIEAAILVCELRPMEATRVLQERYAHCDPPLRVRVLSALGRCSRGGAERFLEGVAAGVGLDAQVATEAIASSNLSPIGRVAALERIAERTVDPDVLRTAIDGLARAGDGDLDARERAGRALIGVLARAQGAVDVPRDELLVALARLGVEEETLRSIYLELPLENAAAELGARFAGRTLASREFLYRGDLRATARLAHRGVLGREVWGVSLDALAARGEGRLLLLLAAAARGNEQAEPVFRRLLIGSAVALEGEPQSTEVELELARVYATLLSLDLDRSRFTSAAAWASRLGRDWRLGVLSERDLQRLLGGGEQDPGWKAYLPASALQAKALVALSQGRAEAARGLAERGRAVAGESERALKHQELLDAALRAAR